MTLAKITTNSLLLLLLLLLLDFLLLARNPFHDLCVPVHQK
jgi:hypothetical protein